MGGDERGGGLGEGAEEKLGAVMYFL